MVLGCAGESGCGPVQADLPLWLAHCGGELLFFTESLLMRPLAARGEGRRNLHSHCEAVHSSKQDTEQCQGIDAWPLHSLR